MLFTPTCWTSESKVHGLSSMLAGGILPGNDILSFLALAVMLLWGEANELMLLVLYDHTVQYLQAHLTPDFLARVMAASNFELENITLAEASVQAVRSLNIRTIRSARGATSNAVILLAHQRNQSDHSPNGQWYDDPGIRRVAFSRARYFMLVIGDTRLEHETPLNRRDERLPGLAALTRAWPTFRQDSENAGRLGRMYPQVKAHHSCNWRMLNRLTTHWSNNQFRLMQIVMVHRREVVSLAPIPASRDTTSSTLLPSTAMVEHTAQLLATLGTRRVSSLQTLPSDTRIEVDVRSFNSAAKTGSIDAAATTDGALQDWLRRVSSYAVPAVHWNLLGSPEVTRTSSPACPHWVSVPFLCAHLPWTTEDSVYDEHLHLAKLFCPPGHELCILRHNKQSIATEHTMHYWKECQADRFAVAVRRRSAHMETSPRLYAYAGMRSKRMLPCLQSVVVFITDLEMVCHVARVLGRHWTHYVMNKEDVVVWKDRRDATVYSQLHDAWLAGCSERRNVHSGIQEVLVEDAAAEHMEAAPPVSSEGFPDNAVASVQSSPRPSPPGVTEPPAAPSSDEETSSDDDSSSSTPLRNAARKVPAVLEVRQEAPASREDTRDSSSVPRKRFRTAGN